MELDRIQYRGFKPREEVERDAQRIVEKILEESPAGGTARVVIADQGDQFHISVVGTTQKKLFSSESLHKKKDLKGWPRTWQLGALAELVGDLMQQVRHAFKSKE